MFKEDADSGCSSGLQWANMRPGQGGMRIIKLGVKPFVMISILKYDEV